MTEQTDPNDPFAVPEDAESSNEFPLTQDGSAFKGPPPPPPNDIYECTCIGCELKPAGESGFQYYKWTFRIEKDCDWRGEEVDCITSLSPSATWGLATMMKAFGFDPVGKTSFNGDAFIGKKVNVKTKLKEFPKGSGQKQADASRVMAYTGPSGEDIPF